MSQPLFKYIIFIHLLHLSSLPLNYQTIIIKYETLLIGNISNAFCAEETPRASLCSIICNFILIILRADNYNYTDRSRYCITWIYYKFIMIFIIIHLSCDLVHNHYFVAFLQIILFVLKDLKFHEVVFLYKSLNNNFFLKKKSVQI